MDTPAPSLTERFTRIVQSGVRALANRIKGDSVLGPALPVPMLDRIGTRLHNLRRRFATLVERIEAGTLRPLPELGQFPGQSKPRKPEADRTPKPRPEHKVRENWAWVVAIGRQPAAVVGLELQGLLEDPKLQALIAAHPRRFGPILRPLCRMFGVHEIPDVLRLKSQEHIPTIDFAAVDRQREAELAARAAGLPQPAPLQTTFFLAPPGRSRPQPFRFYLTPFGAMPDGWPRHWPRLE